MFVLKAKDSLASKRIFAVYETQSGARGCAVG
jgi:hypothetical protein